MKKIVSVVLFTLICIMFITTQKNTIVFSGVENYQELVTLGNDSTMILTKESISYTFGRNNYGQLGNGANENLGTPYDIINQLSLNTDEVVEMIEMGGFHSALMTSEGRIFTWGANEDGGQLGDGTITNSNVPIDITSQFTLNSEEEIVDLNMSVYYSGALTSEGRLFMWGDNSRGQLGNASNTSNGIPVDITPNFSLALGEVITDFDLGDEHAIAVTSTGRVFTWGNNTNGGLGDGTTISKNVPTDITSQFSFVTDEVLISIELGYRFSAAITSTGRVFTWGYNFWGNLGNDTEVDVHAPTEITNNFGFASDEVPIQINAAYIHTGLITSTGRLFIFGNNTYGQLGTEGMSGTNSNLPIDITSQFALSTGEKLVYYEGGYGFSSAITSYGNVYMWGDNSRKQLGDGTAINAYTPQLLSISLAGPDITPPTFDTIIDQVIDEDTYNNIDWTSYIANESDNVTGQLTKIEVTDNVQYDTPGTYTVTVKVVDVALNETSQTFNVEVVEKLLPTIKEMDYTPLYDTGFEYHQIYNFIDVALGISHSLAYTEDSRVFTWGNNSSGQLGNGTNINELVPFEITNQFMFDSEDKVTAISSGGNFSILLTEFGRVFTWGDNDSGGLGNGTIIENNYPIDITNQFSLNPDETIIDVSAGASWAIAVTSTGRIFGWGENSAGELGDSTTTDRYTPVETTQYFSLETDEVITNIGSGYYHSIVLTSTGRVFAFGHNQYYQCGIGTSVLSINTPRDITSSFSFGVLEYPVDVSGGYYQSVLLTSEGRVFTWGLNFYGELGNGSLNSHTVPTDVTNNFSFDTDEKAIISAAAHTMTMIFTDKNRIFTFGSNSYGQLGDGTTTASYNPIDVTSNFVFNEDEEINKLNSKSAFAAMVTTKGRIFIFGYNDKGQLGDSTTESSSIPTPVIFDYLEIKEYSNLDDISYIQYVDIISKYRMIETTETITLGIYPDYNIGPDVKIITINNVPYEEFTLSRGIIIVEVPIVYDFSNFVIYDVSTIEMNDGTILDLTGNHFTMFNAATQVITNILSFDFIEKKVIESSDNIVDWTEHIYNAVYRDNEIIEMISEDNIIYNLPGIYSVTVTITNNILHEYSQTFEVEVIDTEAPGFIVQDRTIVINQFDPNGSNENYTIPNKIVFHYVRDDGDYENWNIWIWGKDCTYSDSDNCGIGIEFDGIDENGAYLNYDLNESTINLSDYDTVGFIVRYSEPGNDWVKKDIIADRYFSITQLCHSGQIGIYIKEGVQEFEIDIPEYNIDWLRIMYYLQDNSIGELTRVLVEDTIDYQNLGTYPVTVGLYDEWDNYSEETFNVTVVDVNRLYGTLDPGVDTIYEGDEWIDNGVSVYGFDEYDIKVTGEVNTHEAGEYEITYTISSYRINSFVIKRLVNVLEKTPEIEFLLNPAITTISINTPYNDTGCMVEVYDTIESCTVLSNDIDTTTPGVYSIVYYIEVDDVVYTKTRYVFVLGDVGVITLYYRKEKELTIV